MHLVERFIRNPTKVAVGVMFLVLFGVISFMRMPIQLTPEVESPVISIETRWIGASPQEVEREITQAQEEQLKGLEGMVEMTSESKDSESEIRVELAVGTSMPEALLKVNSLLQQVREYPIDAEKPVIRTRDLSRRSIGIFVFRPRVAEADEIAMFQRQHPELADLLEPARIAFNTGLRLQRLRELAEQHPEIQPLLPPGVNVQAQRRFAENVIEARLERVDGVGDARVLGGRQEELQVIVDPRRLAARQLTIVDLRRVLETENKDTSAGDIWEGKRRYTVRTPARFRGPEDVEEVIVARRAGGPVYVRDVAKVQLGYRKPEGIALRIGSESLTLLVSRQNNANVLDVMEGLRAAVHELNEGILKSQGMMIEQVYDETDYVYSAVGLVQQAIFVGGALTVIVLLLFLRSARSTLVVGVAIPVCIIGTFLVLNLLSRSLNVVSLAGLAFAVGMLVDNAVVVLENVYRHYQMGDNVVSSVVDGTREVWGAVVASTLTTLAVFLPVLFVQEEAGQLFRDIALAISSAVALSLVVSVIVIPTAAARLLRKPQDGGLDGDHDLMFPEDESDNGHASALDNHVGSRRHEIWHSATPRWLGGLTTLGQRFVSHVVRVNMGLQRGVAPRVLTVVGFIGGACLLSWLLMPKAEYLPSGNRNLIYGSLSLPPGYNLNRMEQVGRSIEKGLRPYWDVDVNSEEAKQLKYPPIRDFFFIAFGREVFMGVRSEDPMRAKELIPLIRQLTSNIPGAIGGARQSSLFSRGRGAGRSIDVEITGPEIETLVALGHEVMNRVAEVIPDAQAKPEPSLDLSSPEIHVLPRREQAADMGMSAEDVGYTVNALIDGALAGDYFLGSDKVDLRIIGQDEFAGHTEDIDSLPIAVPTGQVVPLGAIANVQFSSGPEQINHRERQRAITISVAPPESMPLGEAMDQIREMVIQPVFADDKVSPLYQINLSGTADDLVQTWNALRWNVALAVLITYLLMAALFESWIYPLVIILSVPLGAVGGILGLRMLNVYLSLTGDSVQHLDVLTMLGFVILIGTVVNNAILIVHQSLNLMRRGQPRETAVLESVGTRVRPIFMTTTTTVLGLLPLVLFPGAGSELYRGLGSVVLGGLVVSTMFTLVLVPTLFTLTLDVLDALARRLTAWRRPKSLPRELRRRLHRHRVPESVDTQDSEVSWASTQPTSTTTPHQKDTSLKNANED